MTVQVQEQVSRKDITERLYQELGSVRLSDKAIDSKVLERKRIILFDTRKYYNQAHNYMIIPILKQKGKPIPDYMISLSELSLELRNSIERLTHNDIVYVFKTAVGRIFEDIIKQANENPDPESKSKIKLVNPKLYHDSIYRILKVRLVH